MNLLKRLCWQWMILGFAGFPILAQAQYFNVAGNGDLIGGFRKTGAHQGTNELVVYLGNVTNVLALSAGSAITMDNVGPARLTDAFGSNYTYLQWSVLGANYSIESPWSTALGDFPRSTIWYTLARTNAAVQSIPKARYSANSQGSLSTAMASITSNAAVLSEQQPGGTNANNNTILVREPVQPAYSQFLLSASIGDQFDPTFGDLGGGIINFTVEQTTPSPFSYPSRADLYESAPAAGGRVWTTYPDPITGSTSNVYYVGYFELSPVGVLTFTRAGGTANNPPPAPRLGISVAGGTSTISFSTANGATYTLLHTNFSGLTAPQSTWPVLGTSIIGNGGVMNFTVTLVSSDRVYCVMVQ